MLAAEDEDFQMLIDIAWQNTNKEMQTKTPPAVIRTVLTAAICINLQIATSYMQHCEDLVMLLMAKVSIFIDWIFKRYSFFFKNSTIWDCKKILYYIIQ